MAGDLKINITGDASSAVAAFKNTTVAANAAAPAVLKVGEAFDKASFDAAAMANQMSNYTEKTKVATQAIQEEVAAQKELSIATQSSNTGMSGFIDTQQKAKVAFTDVARLATGQGFSIQSLARNFSLLGPQVVIGIAAIYLLVEGLQKLGDTETFAQKQQEALNLAIGNSQAATTSEIDNVKSLVAIATDESLSRKARTQAMQELNKEYPSYFTNATLDGVTSEKLAAITDRLTSSILLYAKAKAIQAQIDASAARVSEAQFGAGKDLLSTFDKIKGAVAGIALGFGAEKITDAENATKNFNKVVTDETDLQKGLAKQLQDTNTALANQGSLFTPKKTKDTSDKDDRDYAKAETDEANFLRRVDELGETAREKEISEQQAKYQKLKAELEKNDIDTQAITIANAQAIVDINDKYDAINKDNDDKFAAEDVDAMIKQFDAEQREAKKNADELIRIAKEAAADYKAELQGQVNTGAISQDTADNASNENAKKLFQNILNNTKLTPDQTISVKLLLDSLGYKKSLTDAEKATLDFRSKVADIIKGLAVNELAQVGVLIADIFTGSGIGDAVKGFVSLLGDALITIGKYTIETAIKIQAIKDAINKLIGTGPLGATLAIGLGIGAIALGTILKNQVSGVKAFAEGGIVTGPTNALIGEAGPEVVFPLAKLNKFVKGIQGGGGSSEVQFAPLDFRLQGSDLYASIQAETKNRNRFR